MTREEYEQLSMDQISELRWNAISMTINEKEISHIRVYRSGEEYFTASANRRTFLVGVYDNEARQWYPARDVDVIFFDGDVEDFRLATDVYKAKAGYLEFTTHGFATEG